MTREKLEEIKTLARDPKSAAFHDCMARQAIPLIKALEEAWAKNDAAHEVIQMILEADALKPEAYEPWGEEESIYDACKRIVDEWRLP